jgi:hypothetical protein
MIGGRSGKTGPIWLFWLAMPVILWAQPRLHCTYQGMIFQPPRRLGAPYARGASETPGTIAPEGVYLLPGDLSYQITFHRWVEIQRKIVG